MVQVRVAAVQPRQPEVAELIDALTVELAGAGYSDEQTFGYSAEQLEDRAVHLVGAWRGEALVGIAGLEHQHGGTGELKRFYVRPEDRGAGVADALLEALVARAAGHGLLRLRLETGDRQLAAIGLYRRHGFVEIPRFGPYVHSASSYCMQRELDHSFGRTDNDSG